MTALLAAAPALPLDEAGKYVAGAFIVFVAVIFIYFGDHGEKLQRMERELGELNAALAARDRAVAGAHRARGRADVVSEVLAIGVSHKTAPVAVRERLALLPGSVPGLPA